jgi:hypothetical protein
MRHKVNPKFSNLLIVHREQLSGIVLNEELARPRRKEIYRVSVRDQLL